MHITGSADLVNEIGKNKFVIPPQMSEKVFEIQTKEDNVSDENAGITVTIQVGETYLIGVQDFVTFRVFDDDSIPKLSITSLDNTPITEGMPARFELTATAPANTNLSITYSIADPGNFAEQPLNEWVLPANSITTEATLDTIDDKIIEPEGIITVTLLSTAEYGLTRAIIARVTVQDNETLPVVSLQVDGPDSIMEGEPINLKLVADQPSVIAVEVGIWLNGTIKYIQGRHRFRLIPVQRGDEEVAFSLEANDDLVDRRNGRISISLVSGEKLYIRTK